MMRNTLLFYCLFITLLLCLATGFNSCNTVKNWPSRLQTIPEKTNYEQTSTYSDVMDFINFLTKLTPFIHVDQLATTPYGKTVPIAVLAKPPVITPQEARESGKPVIYLQGAMHGGEVDGKEALLEIMREILIGTKIHLLDEQIILICPIFNPDGNDLFSESNRPGDNGPALAGESTNADGYDLSYDTIKAEAIETKGLLNNVLIKWDPILFVDLHTGDGSWHGYSLTYAPPYNPAGNKHIAAYVQETFLPAVRETLNASYGMETFLSGTYLEYPPLRWMANTHKPSFIINYMGLRNRMAILSESFANDPFKERILSSKLFALSVLDYTSTYGQDIKQLIEDTDEELIMNISKHAGDFSKGIEFRVTAQDKLIDLLMYEMIPVENPSTGQQTLEPTGHIITIPNVQLFNKYESIKTALFPRGYLFPAALSNVAKKLKEHGIKVIVLDEYVHAEGEEFIVTGFNTSTDEKEKHFETHLEGYFQESVKKFPPGTYLVDLAQPLANLAFYMLEPESDDSLVRWNYFDDFLRENDIESGEVSFPVFKYLQVSSEGCN